LNDTATEPEDGTRKRGDKPSERMKVADCLHRKTTISAEKTVKTRRCEKNTTAEGLGNHRGLFTFR